MIRRTMCHGIDPAERYEERTAETDGKAEETPSFLNDDSEADVELLTDGGDE